MFNVNLRTMRPSGVSGKSARLSQGPLYGPIFLLGKVFDPHGGPYKIANRNAE
jgi:hypothetical protein